MKENNNTPQPPQESSGIMELFASMIILQLLGGGMLWGNTGRNLLLDVLKSEDDGKIKELAAKLNADEEMLRQGIGSIRETFKTQAEKNGMSVEELIRLFE